jgi:hypothetical protein
MEWAQRAGILRGIKIPPELLRFMPQGGSQGTSGQSSGTSSSTPQAGTSKSAQRDAKVADYVAIGLDVHSWYKQQRAQGKTVTPQQIEAKVRAEVIKYKIKNMTQRDLNKAVKKITTKVKKYLAFF